MNVQWDKNHIFMNVQSGENYIFMNVQLGENHIFMNESGVQGALHGGNYSGGCKAMYHTLIKGLWLSDIGRMAEVRKVPHLACKV